MPLRSETCGNLNNILIYIKLDLLKNYLSLQDGYRRVDNPLILNQINDLLANFIFVEWCWSTGMIHFLAIKLPGDHTHIFTFM